MFIHKRDFNTVARSSFVPKTSTQQILKTKGACCLKDDLAFLMPVNTNQIVLQQKRCLSVVNNKTLDGCSHDVRSDWQLCGSTLAYMLELFMANPNLLEFVIWSGASLGPLDSKRFWPIPNLDSLCKPRHNTDFENYPHCLQSELAQMDDTFSPDCQKAKWNTISSIWHYYRFELDRDLKANLHRWGPPEPQHLCHAVTRQQLVLVTGPSFDREDRCLHENYVRRVHCLPLPVQIGQFLVYEDMWPDLIWFQHIRDWALYKFWNVTCTATHHSSPNCGKGTVFHHGFIRLQDLKEGEVK
ncbi:hypothetical protein CRM22_010942 [Opisthorchis felineus]|uniref:Uncharacterized protein n=1 Tax=Opisthorchis felineus TaxID=147828 RepID=A0A4S2KH65_OPIFE|nr:hypothetical protein CRM22_010942 [Opisthorchis felineus]